MSLNYTSRLGSPGSNLNKIRLGMSQTTSTNDSFTPLLGQSNSTLGNIILGVEPSSGVVGVVYNQVLSDNIVLSENLAYFISKGFFSDTVVFSDQIDGASNNKYLIDTLAFNDQISTRLYSNLTASDTLTFGETLAHVIYQTTSDTLITTDSINAAVYNYGQFQDTLNTLDNVVQHLIGNRTLADGIDIHDQFLRTISRLQQFSDTASFTDKLNGYASKLLGDGVTFVDILTQYVARRFKDTLELGDIVNVGLVSNRKLSDQITLYDSFSYNSYLTKALADSLLFSDSIKQSKINPVNDILAFTELANAVVSTPITDQLAITDTIKMTKTWQTGGQDIFNFTDSFTNSSLLIKTLSDSIKMLDTMAFVRQRFANIQDSITLSDNLFREIFAAPLNDNILFSDSLSYTHKAVVGISDTLTTNDSMTFKHNAVAGRSDYLLLSDGFVVKANTKFVIPNPGVYHPPLPPIPSLQGTMPPYETPSQLPDYQGSQIFVGVVRILPQVVIQGFQRTIVLPPPDFNDFTAPTNQIAVQRSMTGITRTYLKRGDREKINWKFTIPRPKANELSEFLLVERSNQLNLIDWEGNYWSLKVTGDSIDMTEVRHWEPGGNAVEVTLVFEGARYA